MCGFYLNIKQIQQRHGRVSEGHLFSLTVQEADYDTGLSQPVLRIEGKLT